MSLRKKRRRKPARKWVGRVSYYPHHGSWWIYYRDGDQQIWRRVTESEEDAERIASQINAQLSTSSPTMLAFSPISVPELRKKFLAYHEEVLFTEETWVTDYEETWVTLTTL